MTRIAKRLEELAREIADRAQQRVTRLEREMLDLEAAIVKKRAERDLASRAHQNRLNFRVTLGTDYQCPRCWIDHETRTALSPMHGTNTEDIFHCRECGLELSVPDGK